MGYDATFLKRSTFLTVSFGVWDSGIHIQGIVIEPPVRGRRAIYNPPCHPILAFDFLAVDENKLLYSKGNFLRHLVSSIPVEDTFTWSRPVFSPLDGIVVACHDVEDDRKEFTVARWVWSQNAVPHVLAAF